MTHLRLFDVNSSFGNPATGAPDCPAAARLAHMDRLGVARSRVRNVEATQSYPLAANRLLLDAIAHTPGAGERLVPALIVSGLVPCERNGIERFAAQMEEISARPLRDRIPFAQQRRHRRPGPGGNIAGETQRLRRNLRKSAASPGVAGQTERKAGQSFFVSDVNGKQHVRTKMAERSGFEPEEAVLATSTA